MTAKQATYHALNGAQEGEGLTPTQRVLFATIVAAVIVAVVGTEPELPEAVSRFIGIAETVVGVVFLVEYVARVWSIGVEPRYAGLRGRLRYMATPMPIIDLLALLPFLLGALGAESLVLRAMRVLRLIALTKMARYSHAMRLVVGSVVERRFELGFALLLASLIILFASAALYVIEGANHPQAFGSILRSMWWAVVTLTTVGYGDVVPLSPLGKVFASLTAIAGIGMIAMPTGILAAAFSDGFAKARHHRERKG